MKMLLYFTVGRMCNGTSKEGLLYMLVRMRSPTRSGISLACQCQKLLIGLDTLCQKLPVPEQGIGRDRGGRVLRSLAVGDVVYGQRDAMGPGSLCHARHPITGKRTLVGIVEHKAGFCGLRVLGTGLELGRRSVRGKRQVHQRDAAVGHIRRGKALMLSLIHI